MKRFHAGLFAAVALLGMSLSGPAAEPAKIIAVVEFDSLTKVAADLKTGAQALSLPLNTDVVVGGMCKSLGVSTTAGFDTNKPFRVYIVLPPADLAESDGPGMAVVFPVEAGGKTYLEALRSGFKKTETRDGIHVFADPVSPEVGVPALYVAIAGDKNRAIVSPDLSVVQVVAANAPQWPAESSLSTIPGTARMAVDVAVLTPTLAKFFANTAGAMRSAPPPAAIPGMPSDPSAILASEGDLVVAILKQIKIINIGLSIRAKSIDLAFRCEPVAGTPVAGVVKTLHTPADRYLAALPANSVLSLAGSEMNMVDAFIEPYGAFVEKVYGAMGPGMTNMIPLMRKTMKDMKGLYSGDYVIGVVPSADGKSASLVEVVAVSDPKKVEGMMTEMLSMWDTSYAQAAPGLKLSEGASRTRDGVKIRSFSYAMDKSKVDAANPMASPMMAAMPFFSKMKWETATVGNDMVMCLGTPQAMDDTLARLKAGDARIDKSKTFTDLFPEMRHKPTKVYSFRVLSLLKLLVTTLSPQVDPQMLAIIPDSPGGIAGYAIKDGDNATEFMRISMNEVAAIKNSGQLIGMMLAQAVMSGMLGPGAPTMDAPMPRNACVNNLRIIDAAKEQAAMANRLTDGAVVTEKQISVYMKGGQMPACPDGGKYTIHAVGKNPTCSVPGHVLPEM